MRFDGYVWGLRSRRFFLNDKIEEIEYDLIVSHDADIFEDEVVDMNISQPLTQEGILRQIKDVLAAIKS